MRKQGPFLHELLFILDMNDQDELKITGAHTKSLTRILDDDNSTLSAQMGSATPVDLADSDQLSVAIGAVTTAMSVQIRDLTAQINDVINQLNESNESNSQLVKDYNSLLESHNENINVISNLKQDIINITSERDDALLREESYLATIEMLENQLLEQTNRKQEVVGENILLEDEDSLDAKE